MIEHAIIARLKDKLPSHVHVMAAADLEGVAEGSQPTPAVHVVYDGYRVVESRPDGRAVRIEQTWLAIIAVRNVRQARAGQAARDDAMALFDAVAGALMGWQPEGASSPARMTTAPQAGYSAGYLYLPLAFTIERTVRAP